MDFFESKIKASEKSLLIAPLHWGLGHATRCIPIIEAFQSYDFKILIAATGSVKTLLKNEFPNALFFDVPNAEIKYSSNKKFFLLKMLLQLPSLSFTIKKERKWLKQFLQSHSVNVVISDNRLGFYNNSVPSIYITHQLNIITRNMILDTIVSYLHHKYIKNYTQCWVPDFGGGKNLAGRLSHPALKSPKTFYIGCLSRFYKKNVNSLKSGKLLVILSGPEPQRSLLENIILTQAAEIDSSITLVRGVREESHHPKNLPKNVVINNYSNAVELNRLIEEADFVICRSGYTSIMDLVKLQKRAVLIPTPGQTEQEYLAEYVMKQNLFPYVTQENFSIKKAVSLANSFSYSFYELDMELYKKIIDEFVKTI